MNDTERPTDIEAAREHQQRRQRYETWMDRCIGGGIVALFVAMALWVVFEIDWILWIGSLALPAGYLGYIAIEYASPVEVRDEREIQVEHEAGRLALYIIGFVGVVLTPLATTADTTGRFDVPELVWGAILGWVLLFVLLGLTSWWVERSRS
jgi:low temperature requirement protein LtrA